MKPLKFNSHSIKSTLSGCHTLIALSVITLALSRSSLAQTSNDTSSLGALKTSSLLGNNVKNDDFGKLPTNIKSDSLTLNAKSRIFTYKGNVVVTQGDMTLTSKVVEGNYNEQNQIQKIVAKGDVVITKQDIKATSQLAVYDAVSSIVTLTDNPQLQQAESTLIADRIKVYLNEDRSQAEGNVRVTFVKTTPTPIPPTPTPTPEPKIKKK
jgi:lipopolysaccharide export system protein LptA